MFVTYVSLTKPFPIKNTILFFHPKWKRFSEKRKTDVGVRLSKEYMKVKFM